MTTYPQTLKFKAENWISNEVEVLVKSETEFTVQGYDFKIGKVEVNDDGKYAFEFTEVYSLEHSKTEPTYCVSRDLRPNDWSDDLYHASESGYERTGKSVQEVIAKLVAMCY